MASICGHAIYATMMAIASRRRTAMVTFSANGDRIAPDGALMQHLHPRALDKAHLDQPAFKFDIR